MSFCPRVFRMRLLVIVGEYLAKEYVIYLLLIGRKVHFEPKPPYWVKGAEATF